VKNTKGVICSVCSAWSNWNSQQFTVGTGHKYVKNHVKSQIHTSIGHMFFTTAALVVFIIHQMKDS
jgi:hypothetical protein